MEKCVINDTDSVKDKTDFDSVPDTQACRTVENCEDCIPEPNVGLNSTERKTSKDQEKDSFTTMTTESKPSVDILASISALAKQKKHSEALALCDKALESDQYNEKILEKKVKILCQQGNIQQAFNVASEWTRQNPEHPVAQKELKRLQTVIAVLQDQDSDEEESPGTVHTSPPSPVQKLPHHGQVKPTPKNIVRVLPPQPPPSSLPKQKNEQILPFLCSFCDIRFSRHEELDTHCQSDLHKKRLASDENQNWSFRPPPRSQTSEEYMLCQRFCEMGRCPYGDKCTQAHTEAELEEWRERFNFRKQQLQSAREKQLHGNTFTEQLLERLTNPDGPKTSLVSNLEFVKIHENSILKGNMSTKKCTNAWTFTVTSKLCLHGVALLDDANRSYFHISSISVGPRKTQKYQNLETHCQEWINHDTANKTLGEYVYRIKIVFKTDIYGSFHQTLAFDFGLDAIIMRETKVESAPTTDHTKVSKDLVLSAATRWTQDIVTVGQFLPKLVTYSDQEQQLVGKYVLPRPEQLSLSETLVQSLSKENYRLWMHEMLYLEEMAELGFIQRFNVTASLQLVDRFLLIPGSLSSAKYAREGELFAHLKFEDVLSEDSVAGRLILQNCQTAWLAPASDNFEANQEKPCKVYEVLIEDKGKNFVFLRLSSECVAELNLISDQEFSAQIQFQINRLPKCEMHAAVDALSTLSIAFPDMTNIPELTTPDEKVLSGLEDMALNTQQREAILTITAPLHKYQPPLLIIGPFGTGKTYTLAQAAKLVLMQENTRILICTHSNSAADLYIKDFFHPGIEKGHNEMRPLRLYYRFRWVQTVPEEILQYSLFQREGEATGTFMIPSLEDIEKHRVIITTLSTARYVCDAHPPLGFFTHIFIDEAAQALESETLIPLSLAGENTRIVLAGDHMQMSPEVTSDYARQQGFHISFLERLYDLYPHASHSKVMLCENYRSHAAIVDFTSELFYDHQLIASGKQSPHPSLYPLSFFAAMGQEVQHENNTGFYNLSEMYEIVDVVEDLVKKWPEEWGNIDNNGISVVAPYMDQVIRIRGELRKRKLNRVSVERVLNVQGKQYRVIIISAVRTRRSCRSDNNAEEFLDYGFLSNVKLLNTAITRAQSLVLVVADPVSLCLVGKCRKIWEYFLEICHQNNSLFGITWAQLRSQLDRAEVAKNYVLNPLAPEFIPNRLYHITRTTMETAATATSFHQPVNWPYLAHQQYPYKHITPYQMYPSQMTPYYLPMYKQPFVGQFVMRGVGGGMWNNHKAGAPRSNPQHPPAAAPRAEGARMVDMPHTQRAKSHHRGRMAMYVPRMPYAYPYAPMHPIYPYNHYPSHPGYYVFPDDPRLAGLPHQYPYIPQVSHLGPLHLRYPMTGPYTHFHGHFFHQGMPSQAHPNPLAMHGHISPGSHGEGQDLRGSPEIKSGPGFQVLPNVKHVPAHLLSGISSSSQNSSRSSTPVSQTSASTSSGAISSILQEGHSSQISERPYSPANYASARSSTPLSLDETSGDHSNSHERETLSLPQGAIAAQAIPIESAPAGKPGYLENHEIVSNSSTSTSSKDGIATHRNNKKTPEKLRLHTGFSRQFSDDLPTPSAITDIVRMIEDNTIDEDSEYFDDRSPSTSPSSTPHRSQIVSQMNSRNAALSSLQLNLFAAQKQQHDQAAGVISQPSTSSPSSGSSCSQNGHRPTYEDIVRKSDIGLIADVSQMEPQTPRTPSGFITPGVDLDMDPFGILKSLNIEATTERTIVQDTTPLP